METIIDTIDTKEKLKGLIQSFLQKGFRSFNEPEYYTSAWQSINGITLFGKDIWFGIIKLSIDDIFKDFLLPKVLDINQLFLDYIGNTITRDDIQIINKLVAVASSKQILIIPVMKNRSIIKPFGDDSIILFATEPNDKLTQLGISIQEQILFYLAHEMGHCTLHHYYQSSFKTNEKQVLEYILFNEKMAWHLANDFLFEHNINFCINNFQAVRSYSLEAYRHYYSNRKSVSEIFIEP